MYMLKTLKNLIHDLDILQYRHGRAEAPHYDYFQNHQIPLHRQVVVAHNVT